MSKLDFNGYDRFLDREIERYCKQFEESEQEPERLRCTRCGIQNNDENVIYDFNTKKEYCRKCNHDLSIDFLAD
jgi:late competence protein required for DNA uptake (superfamily II DNA/RNA helicase)